MFEIIFLGTSASAPSVRRGLPAQVIKHEEHRFLIDCGEGTQRQILTSGIGFKRLNRILITHNHLDHILGIGGLISTLTRWETMDQLEIYGAESALERVENLVHQVVLRNAKPGMPIIFHPIEPGIFFETDDLTVSAFPVKHRGAISLGYLFAEKGRRPFLPEKAEALNIPPGPWRRDLVQGKPITLPDGRSIDPESVLGEYKPGIRVAFTGDTGETESIEPYLQNVDMLVSESTYLNREAEMAEQFGHLTAKQAAQLAKKVGARRLILTHLSRRYREKDIRKEAAVIFPDVMVARDFDVVQVKQAEDDKKEAA
ncbi:MAG: ribonuclease Z [Anaerolineaceae bacterium]|nr:ribonuclease Z [Anaerolineaceae bacterium]